MVEAEGRGKYKGKEMIESFGAARDFKEWINTATKDLEASNTLVRCKFFLSQLSRAVLFSLPPAGQTVNIFEPEKEFEVQIEDAHLPFPLVCIERKVNAPEIENFKGEKFTILRELTLINDLEKSFRVWQMSEIVVADGSSGWADEGIVTIISKKYPVRIKPGYVQAACRGAPLSADPSDIPPPDILKGTLCGYAALVAQFISLCSCTNIRPIKVREPSEKMQRAAERRGKPPHDTYWTLDLFVGRADEDEGDEQPERSIGSHASPRFHLRRGHIRRLPTGRNTWVRSCAVGSRALGTANKDYRIVLA